MQIDTYLARLADPNPAERRAALEAAFKAEGFSPAVQEQEGDEKLRSARNYLLPAAGSGKHLLFCAHYDACPGSPGANDNAAACCILLALAVKLRELGIPASFAFFDGEERGHAGAKLFLAQNTREYSAVINLDMCGYGDTVAVYARGSEKRAAVRAFCSRQLLDAHRARLVKYMPEGDDVCFTTRRQPVLSIAVMPRWDAKLLDAMALQGSGILGRTPEFHMMFDQLEVVSTMHGNFRDALKWVQPEAMQQVYDYLLDAVCAPPLKKRFL